MCSPLALLWISIPCHWLPSIRTSHVVLTSSSLLPPQDKSKPPSAWTSIIHSLSGPASPLLVVWKGITYTHHHRVLEHHSAHGTAQECQGAFREQSLAGGSGSLREEAWGLPGHLHGLFSFYFLFGRDNGWWGMPDLHFWHHDFPTVKSCVYPFNQSQTKPFLQLFPVLPVRKITNMLPYPHSPAYISILLLGQSWRKDTITWHSLDAYLGLQCFPTEPTEIQTVSITSDPLCPFPELLFCTCLISSFMRTLLIREWTWHCRVWLTHRPPPDSYSSPSWTTKTSSIVTGYYFK